MTADQLLLVVVTIAVVATAWAAMRWGWRRRAGRQADLPPLPPVPADPGPALLDVPVDGVYVGTTAAGDWLDRIVVHTLGRRSPAEVAVTGAGVLVDRAPEPALFVPSTALRGVRLDRALAGKVVEHDGLVVLTWEHGGRRLDTGLRPRRAEDGRRLHDAVEPLVRSGERP